MGSSSMCSALHSDMNTAPSMNTLSCSASLKSISMKGLESWRQMMYRQAAATCGAAVKPLTCREECRRGVLVRGEQQGDLRRAAAAREVFLQRERVEARGAVRAVLARVDAQPIDQLQHLCAPAAQRLLVRVQLRGSRRGEEA